MKSKLSGLVLFSFCVVFSQVRIPGPGGAAPGGAAPCTPASGYTNCRLLTIDRTKVPSTQANFPVLVSKTVTEWKTVANGGVIQNTTTSTSCSKSGIAVPADLIFTSDSGGTTQITGVEWEAYTASSGLVKLWIKIASVSSSADTVFYASYNKASVTTCQNTIADTWDSNFKGVWHFGDGATLNLSDSTSNGNNGTGVNTPTATTLQIDGAAHLVGASSQDITATVTALNSVTQATLSGWLKRTSASNDVAFGADEGSNVRLIVTAASDGNIYLAVDGAYEYVSNNNTSAHYLTLVYNGGLSGTARIEFYLDGVAQSPTTSGIAPASLSASLQSMHFGKDISSGNNFSTGDIDEVRISTGIARSADWITAEYNNQNDPATFITVGAQV